MSAQPNLRLVDASTGEIRECEGCRHLADQVAGLERDIRGWRSRYAELKRDRDGEAREHPLWTKGRELYALWRDVCNHPRSKWTPDKFWLIEPHLSDEDFGEAFCRRAILGAGFDPFISKRRNGSTKRHDDWDLIFRNRPKAEEFANRAPREAA